eukprot:SAG22_NODE_1046_length_5865_cov_4.719910_8_plen_151_part_00
MYIAGGGGGAGEGNPGGRHENNWKFERVGFCLILRGLRAGAGRTELPAADQQVVHPVRVALERRLPRRLRVPGDVPAADGGIPARRVEQFCIVTCRQRVDPEAVRLVLRPQHEADVLPRRPRAGHTFPRRGARACHGLARHHGGHITIAT